MMLLLGLPDHLLDLQPVALQDALLDFAHPEAPDRLFTDYIVKY